MHHLVEKAFKSLSATCNKTSLHPIDEDRIKVTLKVLHNHNIPINVASLENWLIKNSWQQNTVKNVIKWAEAISSGGRVRIKSKEAAPNEKQIWENINT